MKATIVSAILLLLIASGAEALGCPRKWLRKLCPNDENISDECLDHILPPFPICLKKSAAAWVDQARDAGKRCCGEDMSKCQCPKKDTPAFQEKIVAYCAAITQGGVCTPDTTPSQPDETSADGNKLRGGLDIMEEQVIQES